jgi:capsule biosynthesis phosphatase
MFIKDTNFLQMRKSTFIIDVDDTISQTPLDEKGNGLYKEAKPLLSVIEKIRSLHSQGHTIILFTARGMRTFKGNVEKIKECHYDILVDWLKTYSVPYDQLIFGKPWGPNVYYIDDKGLTINQFLSHTAEQYPDIIRRNTV